MTDQSRTNRYTTDSRGERTPMPHVLRPANPNSPRSSPVTQPSPRVYGFDDQPPRELHRAEPASPVEPGFMEYLHQNSYRQHGHLRSPEFFAERKRLLAQLDAHLQSSTIRNSVGLGDHPSLKSALGISSQSLVHRWNKAGVPGRIPGYATHVAAVSRAAKYMQAGGYIGIGIGGVASLLDVQEVCSADPESAACKKVKFSTGGRFTGSALGGYGGGEVAFLASGKICLALGATTGLGGVACVAAVVGVGSLVGSTAGGVFGEGAGEILYERTQP